MRGGRLKDWQNKLLNITLESTISRSFSIESFRILDGIRGIAVNQSESPKITRESLGMESSGIIEIVRNHWNPSWNRQESSGIIENLRRNQGIAKYHR